METSQIWRKNLFREQTPKPCHGPNPNDWLWTSGRDGESLVTKRAEVIHFTKKLSLSQQILSLSDTGAAPRDFDRSGHVQTSRIQESWLEYQECLRTGTNCHGQFGPETTPLSKHDLKGHPILDTRISVRTSDFSFVTLVLPPLPPPKKNN